MCAACVFWAWGAVHGIPAVPISTPSGKWSGAFAAFASGSAGRGGVDMIVTHAPARGYGDEDNPAHLGFAAFLPLLDQYQPKYLVHGHVHTRYGVGRPRVLQRGNTTIINACERYLLEVPDLPLEAQNLKKI